MIDFLKFVFFGLIPPRGANADKVYRWRVAISLVTGMNFAGMVFTAALAVGAVPVIFGGFAPKVEIQTIRGQVSDIRTSQLEAKILDTRKWQCAAIVSKNDSALKFATPRLQYQLRTWMTLSPQPYRLPECNEL